MPKGVWFLSLVAVSLACPAGALAHGDGERGVGSPQIHTHATAAGQVRGTSEAVFSIRTGPHPLGFGGRRARALNPASWCGSPGDHKDISNAPHIKVVYAYAADEPNSFAAYDEKMQKIAADSSALVSAASGGRREIRWDVGSGCASGSNTYLDIEVVALPQPLSFYSDNNGTPTNPRDNQFRRLVAAVRSALGDSASTQQVRNYVIFADKTKDPTVNVVGEGHVISDSAEGFENSHTTGGRYAVVYGDGNLSTFSGSTIGAATATALHEVGHTLGAVQLDSPNTTGAHHCNDGLDIMCYADAGPDSAYDPGVCGAQVFDCNNDDYFAANPTGYLASHWNLFNSPFLCGPAVCQKPSTPPTVSLEFVGATQPGNGVIEGRPLTLRANTNGGTSFNWDLDEFEGFESPGGQTRVVQPRNDIFYAVRVANADGAWAAAQGSAGFVVPSAGPPIVQRPKVKLTLRGTPRSTSPGAVTVKGTTNARRKVAITVTAGKRRVAKRTVRANRRGAFKVRLRLRRVPRSATSIKVTVKTGGRKATKKVRLIRVA